MRPIFKVLHRPPSPKQLFTTKRVRTIAGISTSTMAATTLYSVTVTEPSQQGAEPEGSRELLHHLTNGKGFQNPWDSTSDLSAGKLFWTFGKRYITGQANQPSTEPPTIPVHKPIFHALRSDTTELRATWLGHACFFVEFPGGLRVLFDPVFTQRCSPLSWLGPKRFTEMPCDIEDIPAIDIVVISHNHYDHLSYPTIMKIKKLHPNVQFFVPLKNRQWFIDSGIHSVTELDWWQDRDITLVPVPSEFPGEISEGNGLSPNEISAKISCLPCQHTSARGPFDKGATLWASWSVASGGKSVWFGGDTGYRAVPKLPKDVDDYGPEYNFPRCPAFEQIGRLRGPFDLGLVPIGAYDPRFLFSSMHANPHDAVNIFRDTRCKKALGIHWGTWVLTEEEVLEPPVLLKAALRRYGVPETGAFDVCDIGESRKF
ncbi:MAG: hypothetical protein M1829_006111 [Trizodia sp. TS-e1964]|nr:MAG: hypothetical protein M1829_006111 [Trizodia sp. TS-e1964]